MIREVVQAEEQAAADARQRVKAKLDLLSRLADAEDAEISVRVHEHAALVTLDVLIDDFDAPLAQLAATLARLSKAVAALQQKGGGQ